VTGDDRGMALDNVTGAHGATGSGSVVPRLPRLRSHRPEEDNTVPGAINIFANTNDARSFVESSRMQQ
jgi:hypothetical protein